MTSTRAAVMVLAGVLATAWPAEAQELRLEWHAPTRCASRSQAERGLAAIVGRSASELVGPWRSASVVITPEDETWRLRVVVVGRDGERSERTVVTPTCEQARDAAIIILATNLVAAESGAGAGAQGSEGQVTPVGPGASAVSGELDGGTRSSPTAAATAEDRLSGGIGVAFGVDLATLPRTAACGQIEVSLEHGPVGVAAVALATDRASGDIAPGVGANVSLAAAGVRGCYRFMASNPAPHGCVGAEAGVLSASGYGGTPSRTDQAAWFAALAEATLRWHVASWVALEVGATGVVPLRTLKVELGSKEVHESPPVGVRAWIGTRASF